MDAIASISDCFSWHLVLRGPTTHASAAIYMKTYFVNDNLVWEQASECTAGVNEIFDVSHKYLKALPDKGYRIIKNAILKRISHMDQEDLELHMAWSKNLAPATSTRHEVSHQTKERAEDGSSEAVISRFQELLASTYNKLVSQYTPSRLVDHNLDPTKDSVDGYVAVSYV